jgi:DNA polymerase-3 subunit beta
MTNETIITVNADLLRAALICASTEQTRYYLNGVYVDPLGYLVSTDGHRMFCGKIDISDVPAFTGWIIPSDVIKRALTGYKFPALTITPTQCGDIACHPVDGTFPEWRRVIPQGDLSGVAAQFNPAYVADLGKIGKLLGGKGSLPAHIHHNGDAPAGVTFPAYPCAFAVLMPIRSNHTAHDSAWQAAVAV